MYRSSVPGYSETILNTSQVITHALVHRLISFCLIHCFQNRSSACWLDRGMIIASLQISGCVIDRTLIWGACHACKYHCQISIGSSWSVISWIWIGMSGWYVQMIRSIYWCWVVCWSQIISDHILVKTSHHHGIMVVTVWIWGTTDSGSTWCVL